MDKSESFVALESMSPLRLCEPLMARHDDAIRYIPPEGLKEALDVAMLLGEPIVLTGVPGAGKTQAAKWLAYRLEAGPVLRFDVKSTTLGGDLLYSFDDLGRFRDAAANRVASGEIKPLVRYLRFNALGNGIVFAAGPNSVLWTAGGEKLEGSASLDRHRKLLADAFGPDWRPRGDAVRVADLLPDEQIDPGSAALADPFSTEVELRGTWRDREVRVVLIDELDKAPRDTPNDLLSEVENMTFLIAELGLRVKTDREVRPIVVITSNAEKPLPEPFLRRCAYFHLPPVRGDVLKKILARSLEERGVGPAFIAGVVEVADLLHASDDALVRKPGTAELLAWSEIVVKFGAGDEIRSWINRRESELAHSLTALLKHAEDQKVGFAMLREWAHGGRSARQRG